MSDSKISDMSSLLKTTSSILTKASRTMSLFGKEMSSDILLMALQAKPTLDKFKALMSTFKSEKALDGALYFDNIEIANYLMDECKMTNLNTDCAVSIRGIKFCFDHGLKFKPSAIQIALEESNSDVLLGMLHTSQPDLFKNITISDFPISCNCHKEDYNKCKHLILYAPNKVVCELDYLFDIALEQDDFKTITLFFAAGKTGTIGQMKAYLTKAWPKSRNWEEVLKFFGYSKEEALVPLLEVLSDNADNHSIVQRLKTLKDIKLTKLARHILSSQLKFYMTEALKAVETVIKDKTSTQKLLVIQFGIKTLKTELTNVLAVIDDTEVTKVYPSAFYSQIREFAHLHGIDSSIKFDDNSIEMMCHM